MDEQYNTSPAMSNDPNTWPDYWPDKDLSWNGYWNGYFGKGVLNADLETVFVFDDNPDKEPNTKWNFYCDEQDTTPVGSDWLSTPAVFNGWFCGRLHLWLYT
jgi:hypothetical protein